MQSISNFLINHLTPGLRMGVPLSAIILVVCLILKQPRNKTLYWSVFVAYIGFLFGTIISFRSTLYKPTANFVLFKDLLLNLSRGLTWHLWQMLGNIGLFIPLGIFLKTGKRPMLVSVLIGLLASLAIELFEYFTMIGILDIDDLLLNTLGTLIGFLLACLFFRIRERRKKEVV